MGSQQPGLYTGIDRSSPMPFYHQLKVIILSMIKDGTYGPGDLLPGELRLCKQYGVSRTVVRQTLVELKHEGCVNSEKGRGTFVSSPKTSQGLVQSLSGQFEDMAVRGVHLRSKVRRLEAVPAESAVAAQMQLNDGSPVVLLERLRFIRDEPWVVAFTYLPIELLPVLQQEDLERGSLYAFMDRLGIRPSHGKRTVEAREAGKYVGKALGIHASSPVLLLTSIGFDSGGRPVEYFETFHRGDRSRFEVDLVRSEGATTPLLVAEARALPVPAQ